MIRLRLHRIARIDPSLQTAKDSTNVGVTMMQQDERRPGARVFVGSGAIGDDPFVLVERQVGRVGFYHA
jgi:hypothetical protein